MRMMRRRKKNIGKRNEMLATVVFGTDKYQYHCQPKSENSRQQTTVRSSTRKFCRILQKKEIWRMNKRY